MDGEVNAVVCRLMIPRSVKNRMVLSMKNTVNGVIQTENSHMTISVSYTHLDVYKRQGSGLTLNAENGFASFTMRNSTACVPVSTMEATSFSAALCFKLLLPLMFFLLIRRLFFEFSLIYR